MLGRAGPNMPDTCSSGPACHASRPAAPGDTGGTPGPPGQDVTRAHPSTPRRASRAQPGARSTRQTKMDPRGASPPARSSNSWAEALKTAVLPPKNLNLHITFRRNAASQLLSRFSLLPAAPEVLGMGFYSTHFP